METMHFQIAHTGSFLGQLYSAFKGVPINNLELMKNCHVMKNKVGQIKCLGMSPINSKALFLTIFDPWWLTFKGVFDCHHSGVSWQLKRHGSDGRLGWYAHLSFTHSLTGSLTMGFIIGVIAVQRRMISVDNFFVFRDYYFFALLLLYET